MRSVILLLLSLAVVGLPAATSSACACDEPAAAATSCCCGPDSSGCGCGCDDPGSEESTGLDASCACDHTPPQSVPSDPEPVTPTRTVAIVADAGEVRSDNAPSPRPGANPSPPTYRRPLLV